MLRSDLPIIALADLPGGAQTVVLCHSARLATDLRRAHGMQQAARGLASWHPGIPNRIHSGELIDICQKYLRAKNGAYYLEPANAKYKPIYPSESFRVEAVVTAVVRKY